MKKRLACIFAIILAIGFCFAEPEKVDFAARARAAFEKTVHRAENRDRRLGVIELFSSAYDFCESGMHLDKLDLLFDFAAQMQDRDPKSRSYGNYRWYFRDGFVMDYNAVDFCMQFGSVMARKHLDKMTPGQLAKFQKLLELSVQGCLNHRVRTSYTNISIMNAVNLILLGEACSKRDVFTEGVRRLDAFTLNTALFGVCEYASPTYNAVDVANLHRLHANVTDPQVRATCEKLLQLFWTDICASAFPGAGRLGGAHSREYDYLYGMGGVAPLLRAADVLPPAATDGKGKRIRETPPLEFALDDWRPDAAMRALATRAGRFVEARWGETEGKTRSFWAGRNIALGVAGANYWNMDIPMAVDFKADRQLVRGYFIADGRRDPYGRKRIPEGKGPHEKAVHLRPFWAGVQRGRDAIGLVMYRPADIPPDTPTLESHFVFPSDADEIRVGEEIVKPAGSRSFVRQLVPGNCVFVRHGGGAFGVRTALACDLKGRLAKTAVVWDESSGVPARRFTVAHHDFWGCHTTADCLPGAVFWVRVCDDADDPKKFEAFRAAFAAAKYDVSVTAEHADVSAEGEEGRLALTARAPFLTAEKTEPRPRPAVLAVDGRDVGAEILGDVPGVAAYRAQQVREKRAMEANKIFLTDERPATWEAETGAVTPNMVVAADVTASGGRYVWAPCERGARGGGFGKVAWQLQADKPGTYHLWGRVSAATPEDDSFFVSASAGSYSLSGQTGPQVLAQTAWHLGTTKGLWKWVRFPKVIRLPKGQVVLTLHERENGAKIDRLFLTADETEEPE